MFFLNETILFVTLLLELITNAYVKILCKFKFHPKAYTNFVKHK